VVILRLHKGWIDEYLGDGVQARQDEWTRSIAVGSRPFIEKVKNILGFRAKGREVIEGFEGYQLRERSAGYEAFFGGQKDDIGLENTYRWEINTV
jgi:putative transposase